MHVRTGLSAAGITFVALVAVSNFGCGGGSASAPPPPPPLISVTLTPATAQKVDQGQSVSFTATVANDSSSKGVKWSLSGTGCMGAACGALSNQTATTATYIAPSPVAANVSVSVTATSAAESTKSASDSVTVFPPPTVATTSLQNATGGSAYNVTLQESGGIAPFTWSLASGSSLPAGLSLDSNGTISGTPTAGGLFNFTVQVADSGNPPVATTAKLSLTVVILPPSPVPATVSGTIEVGTAPVGIAVDPAASKVYVANYGTRQTITGRCQPTGSNVTVIDGATSSTSTITPPDTGSNALAVVVNSPSHATYLIVQQYTWINTIGGNCTPFHPELIALNGVQPIGAFCVICQFGGIAVNSQTGTIYLGSYITYDAGNQVNASVQVSNSSATFSTSIALPAAPDALAVDSATNKVYVLTQGSSDITVIDGATNSASTLPAPSATVPTAIAVNPTTDTIYVANAQSNNVTVIDGATGAVAATVPVGISPVGIAVDEQTNFIYVANAGNSQTGDDPGNVTVIDGATNHTTTLTDPKAVKPSAVAVNSVTNKIYVANSGSNNVTVIDGAH